MAVLVLEPLQIGSTMEHCTLSAVDPMARSRVSQLERILRLQGWSALPEFLNPPRATCLPRNSVDRKLVTLYHAIGTVRMIVILRIGNE